MWVSLHRKRFRASSSRKLGREQKKKERTGEGEGNEVACIASVSARVRRESWDESKKKRKDGGGGGE